MSPKNPIDWQPLREGIAAHMARAGLSQAKLAKASGVSQATLSEFLAGKKVATAETLAAIAAALQVTVGELLGETAEPNPGTDILGLTHDQLVPGLRNPRTTFDEQALDELAESIAEKGVLENLIVGPPASNGVYAIAAGERRWRAVVRLAAAGRTIHGIAAADYRIACRVVDGDAADIMAIALAENLDRQDLSPMEQAEAFAWLRTTAGWSTADIAARIHKSQRFVQRRLALVDKLDDSVKEALREGKINFVQAEAVTLAAKEDQAEIVDDIVNYGESAEYVREQILGEKHPVKDAFFDPALYDGEIIDGDPDDPDDRYFADTPQFERLQRQAAEAKVEALRSEWAWAELRVAGEKAGSFQMWQCGKSKDRKKAGAIVAIDFDGTVKVETGLVPPTTHQSPAPAPAGASAAPPPAGPKRHFTDKHLCLARRIKTTVLQDAVLADHGAALRLCVMGLLGAPEVRVQLSGGDSYGNGAYGRAVVVESAERFKDLGGKIRKHDAAQFEAVPRLAKTALGGGYYGDALDPVATWDALLKMSDADVLSLLATILAAQVGTWNGFKAELGDSDLAARISDAVGAGMRARAGEALRDEDYLKSCGRAHLAEIATDLRCQVKDSHTAKQLRGFIADALPLADEIGYVPRELRWGRDALLPDQRAERERDDAEEAERREAARRLDDADDEDDAIDRLTGRDDDADEDDAPALQASADDDLAIPAFLRRV